VIRRGSGNIFARRGIVLGRKADLVYALDLIEATERHWGLAVRFLDGLGDTDVAVTGFLHRWLT
jgi:hypothetical protein